MKKIRGIFLLCIYLFLPTLTVCAKEEPENLYAQSATLMDADSGRILFEKDGKTVRAMPAPQRFSPVFWLLKTEKWMIG